MNVTQQLIALAMDRLQAKTQRDLAAKLGLSHSMVAFYVSGRSSMKDPANIANVCLLIGEDPQKWFAAIASEESAETRVKSWARKFGAAAALAVALLPLGNANAAVPETLTVSGDMHYAKWLMRRLRRLFAPVSPFRPAFAA